MEPLPKLSDSATGQQSHSCRPPAVSPPEEWAVWSFVGRSFSLLLPWAWPLLVPWYSSSSCQ